MMKYLENLVQFVPKYFNYIPKKYITPNLCKIGVISLPHNYKYVPQKYRTKKLLEIAIENSQQSFNSPLKFLVKNKTFMNSKKNIIGLRNYVNLHLRKM